MKRAFLLSGVIAVLGLGGLLLVPACGPGDYTPCESDIDCLIVCDCPGGGDGIIGPFRCRAGHCGPEHADLRDCFGGCGAPPAVQEDDDDSAGTDDDDSGGGDDDDSAPPRR